MVRFAPVNAGILNRNGGKTGSTCRASYRTNASAAAATMARSTAVTARGELLASVSVQAASDSSTPSATAPGTSARAVGRGGATPRGDPPPRARPASADRQVIQDDQRPASAR